MRDVNVIFLLLFSFGPHSHLSLVFILLIGLVTVFQLVVKI